MGERERGRSIVHCHLVYYFCKFCTKVDCKFTCREERWELGSRQQNLCPPSYSYSSIQPQTSATLHLRLLLDFRLDRSFWSTLCHPQTFHLSLLLLLPVGKQSGKRGRQAGKVGSVSSNGLSSFWPCLLLSLSLVQHFMQISYVSFMPL